MKKILTKIQKTMLCSMLFAFATISASAQTSYEVGTPNAADVIATFSSDSTVMTISGNGAMKNYTFVRGICSYTYKSFVPKVTTVIIGDSITHIGNYTFFGFSALESVSIPDRGIVNIGSSAFENCSSLDSIATPRSVLTIGEKTFSGCTSLRAIRLGGEELISVGSNVFAGCNALRDLYYTRYFPLAIYDFSLYAMNRGMADGAFSDITLYVHNCMVESYREIYTSTDGVGEHEKFKDYKAIPGTEGEDCTCEGGKIGNLDWELCKDVLIISGTGPMPDYKFTGKEGDELAPWDRYRNLIKEVFIEEGVTSIGNYAFFQQFGLERITLSNTVTKIGEQAFTWCEKFETLSFNRDSTKLDSIGSRTFYGCALTEVYLPNSLKYIADGAFANCKKITAYVVGDLNENYRGVGGVLFSKDRKTLVLYPTSREGNYVIPDTVTNIGYGAFTYGRLSTITVGSRVTEIGDYAFAEAENLTSMHLPDAVEKVGIQLFYNDTALKVVTIGKGLRNLGGEPFRLCFALDSIGVHPENEHLESIDGVLYATQTQILIQYPAGKSGDYVMPNWVKGIFPYAFTGGSLTSVVVAEGISKLDDILFSGCTYLKSITIPSTVNEIGSSAFAALLSLEKITSYALMPPTCEANTFSSTDLSKVTVYVPECVVELYGKTAPWDGSDTAINGFKEILPIADYECPCYNGTMGDVNWELCGITLTISGNGIMPDFLHTDNPDHIYDNDAPWFVHRGLVKAVIIEDGVTAIGQNAFEANYNLTDITIPESVTSIGPGAFAECRSLASIEIPSGVKAIGTGTFAENALKTIVLPEGLESIGYLAFVMCQRLEEVTIPSTCDSIGNSAFRSCTALRLVKNYAIEPQKVATIRDQEPFYNAPDKKTIVLAVQPNSIAAYSKANIWKEFNIVDVVSTEDIFTNDNEDAFKVYPNPVNDVFNIQTEQNIKEITVLDLQGRVVLRLRGNHKAVNVGTIPSGNYVVKIITEETTVAAKIVKM